MSSVATELPSHKELLNGLNADVIKYMRLGWLIVILGLGGFLLWALLAPLDKGVPLSGTVAVATNRKAVQHEDGGTIEEILVKEGDKVNIGDVLIRMNNVQVKANADTNRVQYRIALATEARLMAERDGLTEIVFPQALLDIKDDQRVAHYLLSQKQVFSSRQSSLKSELSAVDESISGIGLQTKGLEQSLENKKMQLQFISEQLQGIRELTKQGYVARNRLLELEQSNAQINAMIAETTGNIGLGRRQIAELRLKKKKRLQDYQKEVRTQLSEAQKQVDALASQLNNLDYDLAKVLVKAPVSGTVVGLSVFTKGAVVNSGFRMMDIVPSEDVLVINGNLPVHLIDKVYLGLQVDLMFTAFNRNITPHIPGELSQISADRFTDENTGQPYYKVVIKVTEEGMSMLADLQIKAGMPVEMFVKTGERTMMNYLLKPFYDHLKVSMSEE
ncbi:MAG: hemolysin D [Gammaproteobacteria bacterium]|nr:MAG: hemolysin D [Gammaproteobacteria bacterium]